MNVAYYFSSNILLNFFKAIKELYKNSTLLLCFFHFSQALWRRAGLLGMRESTLIIKTKEIILNLKILCFLKVEDVKNYFDTIKQTFYKVSDSEIIVDKFIEYFEETWISGKHYKINDWNYYGAITREGSEINLSNKIYLTNNAVEGANSLINSMLNKGKIKVNNKISNFKFFN